MNRFVIDSKYILKDSSFGLYFDFKYHINEDVESIKVEIIDVNDTIIFNQIVLPHQLYYNTICEVIDGYEGQINSIRITPMLKSLELLRK